jgi:hypothetical protein
MVTTPVATQYCLPFISWCFTISEWREIATIIATVVTVPGALFAAYKTYQEIKKGRVQREKDQQLKRTEFTLAQHRRLFDDPTLYSVLSLIDGDDPKLKDAAMWDAKRKFITFFEEIELLVSSGNISENVAYYMFGYYAKRALEGDNFKIGIELRPEYWGLFFKFTADADEYLKKEFDPKKISI